MIRKSPPKDASELAWFKSSYSDSSNPNDCVEVATTPATIHIRDSKHNTQGPRLTFTPTTWTDFIPYASNN
ncbi:DUF397 domain-containing protein [Streptomyces sp. W16]|uniref:DUF397 domain-containing protein n=1 Tax=Streptomyces sp. W16 TaxID=3076631 RepID=UPI00295C1D21|nr:DUF397 domain-containing protein [Streptomyces sp. W16]MDV9170581.1 DUF397 domain-containing protein [Streptomyces sp. W16]